MEQRIIGLKKKPKGVVVTFSNHDVLKDEPLNIKNTKEVDRKISAQFETRLKSLLGHALLFASLDGKKIGEKEIKNRRVVDMPEFKNVSIDGFSITGSGEDEKIIIDMTISARGGSYSIKCPAIHLHDPEYEYAQYLAEDVDGVLDETRDFIDGKNYFFQGNLFNEPEKQEKPEKAKKSTKKVENKNDFEQF